MTRALAIPKDKALFTREAFDEPQNFKELLEASKILVASGILPKEIKTAEQCAVVILTGRELGLRMMASTRGIYVVNQKPALSAQMMLALAHNTKELENYEIISEGQGESAKATMTVWRKGKKPYTCSFSVDDAKKMKKFENEWLKQPETMCVNRVIAKNLRVTFPDAILGMYTPEEVEYITAEDSRPATVHEIEMPRAANEAHEDAPSEEVQELPKEVTVLAASDAPPADPGLPEGFKLMKAKFDGICRSKSCGSPEIKQGSEMAYSAKKGTFHTACAQ